MKTRFQKCTALVLVLIMLVTMIPMGIFTATAVSAELSAGLADIANTAEFVINNVDDWKAIAATNDQFLNKTIKLGADIDAQGEALPQLFRFGNARCTFDGQGYTIKNVGTAEAPLSASLFSAKSNINFQNLTVQNVHVKGAGNKGILVDWQNCWGVYTFKNIKVLDSSVESTDLAAGALIGWLSGNGNGYGVNFENILVSGTEITALNKAGGLVGDVYWNSGDRGVIANGIEILDTVITDNTDASCAAGLFGYYRHHNGTSLTVTNAHVQATFMTPNSSGWTGINTALFQSVNSSKAANNIVTVKNCVTDCTYAAGVVQSTTLFYAAQATYVTENLFATKDIGKAGMLTNGGNVVNGTADVSSNYVGVPATKIDAEQIAELLLRDDNGFITGMNAPSSEPENPDPTPDPDPTPTPSEIVINNVDDWKAIAEQNSQFTGSVIKLGADIDAAGATLPPLFMASNAAATFDGQGHTIKNVGTKDAPNPNSLFGAKFNGSILNLTVQNVVISGTGIKAVLVDWLNGWGTNTIENIKIENCQVTSTDNAAGIIVGQASGNADTVVVTFKNINIDEASAATGKGAVGAIYGTGGHSGTINIENVMTCATLTSNGTDAEANCVGGLFGFEYANAKSIINIKNCIIKGELNSRKTHLGSLGGYYNGAETKTMNIEGVICATIFSKTEARYANLLPVVRGNGNFNYKDVYSVSDFANPRWQVIAYNYNTIINGVRCNGELNDRDDILYVLSAQAEKLLHFDETTGFISGVDSILDTCVTQVSSVADGKYAVRFITKTQMVAMQEITMTVKATTASGQVRTFQRSHELYDRVTPFEKHNITADTLATDLNAEQLGCITVYDIPTGEAVTFEVTCSYTTQLGNTVVGNTMTVTIDANGAIVG